jgi:hypothetical protein
MKELGARLADLVRARWADGADAVELRPPDVAAATDDLWHRVPPADRHDPCLPSPDLMVAGPTLDGGRWLLSELHDDCSSIYGGVEAQLFSDPERLFAEFTAALAPTVPPAGMATIVSRRRSAHVTPELPGLSLELSGRSGRAPTDVRPIAAATVTPDGRRLVVEGEERLLYPGDLGSVLHRAVSLPALRPVDIDLGRRTPRIVIDGVIYQRARWRVHLPRPPRDRYDRWREVMRLRRAQAVPTRVFMRHPAQPKPLFIDFADPLAVADMARLGPADVLLTEMLPAPDQLWWRPDGQPQCAELRLGCLVSAESA